MLLQSAIENRLAALYAAGHIEPGAYTGTVLRAFAMWPWIEDDAAIGTEAWPLAQAGDRLAQLTLAGHVASTVAAEIQCRRAFAAEVERAIDGLDI